MAKRFDVYEELKQKGFEETKGSFGQTILFKTYSKEVEVLWYGKQDYSIRVDVWFNPDHSVVKAFYYDDARGVRPYKEKTHLNEKRAYNAICQTVANKGFEI